MVLLGEPLALRGLVGEPYFRAMLPERLPLRIRFGEVDGLSGLIGDPSLTATLDGDPTGIC